MKQATPTQIKQWKAEHGEVHQVEIPLDDEGNTAVAYFKKPTLDILSASAKYAETDPIKSGNIMFESCWLGGDERIKSSDEAKLGAIQVVAKLFKVRVATIKKL